MKIPRREFLLLASATFLRAQNATDSEMIVRSRRPEDLEMPLSGFFDYITPVDRFFVRTHVYVPRVNPDTWRLQVTGEVTKPLSLDIEALRMLPAAELVGVAECAGNGRSFYDPPVAGAQWQTGAVGNGRWKGVRLADVLRHAGIKDTAKEVVFDGADVPLGTMPDFQRSIPIQKALDRNTLLAFEMNGGALPVKHGFPLRVVAPGWASDSWVKWLTSIRVIDREFDGFWMKSAYRHPGKPVAPGTAVPIEQMSPVTSLRVKSVIASPTDGAQVVLGKPLPIRGVAWSGDAGPVVGVEVSVDAGRTWKAAGLKADEKTQFGWRQWELTWTPQREAFYTILARARDSAGNVQPLAQEWNPSGYLWNVVPRIGVDVVRNLTIGTKTPPSVETKPAEPARWKAECGACHDEDMVSQQHLTRAQWDREITKMTGWGAKVSDEDRRELLDYLFKAYGPGLRKP